jgi:glycosyltransferase involved in cell wall biosynthesis
MKPLLFNTTDKGGAATACIRLHNALIKNQIDSKLQLLYKSDYSIQNSFLFSDLLGNNSFQKKLTNKVKRILSEFWLYKETSAKEEFFLKNRSKELELFSFLNSNYDLTKSELYKNCDIVNLHWVSGFLDFASFFKKNTKPVVWTLHDMNAFSGGEHYNEKYIGIDEKGYPIKRNISNEEKNIFHSILSQKQRVIENVNNLHIVTPSDWLNNESKNSDLFSRYPTTTIPYSLDCNVFKPCDKHFARELFGLPKDKIIILFVADNIHNKRKGLDYLLKAIPFISQKDVHFCAVGSNCYNEEKNENLSVLGKIYDERLMSLAYSAADVFVIPSVMDNLPNTVLESLACGTPVIGFPVGGIPEMIDNRVNGLLCSEISVPALVEALVKFINTYSTFDRVLIAQNAQQKYNPNVQAQAYITLYNNMTKGTF